MKAYWHIWIADRQLEIIDLFNDFKMATVDLLWLKGYLRGVKTRSSHEKKECPTENIVTQ